MLENVKTVQELALCSVYVTALLVAGSASQLLE